MEQVGVSNVLYQGAIYPRIPIYYVERPGRRKSFYTTGPFEEVVPEQIRLYPRQRMSLDFDKVIRPLFEGQPVYLDGLDKRSGGEFGQLFKFISDKVPYYLEKPYLTGSLEFYDGPERKVR